MVSSPITRSSLQPVTDLTAGVTMSSSAKGWYTDLGTTSGIGWSVVQNPIAYNGIVAFSTLLTQGDACSPSGQSRVYAVNYDSGTSVLTNNTNTSNGTVSGSSIIAYASFSNAIDDLKFVSHGTNSTELVAGTTTGSISQVPANLNSTIQTRLLNWREVPTAE